MELICRQLSMNPDVVIDSAEAAACHTWACFFEPPNQQMRCLWLGYMFAHGNRLIVGCFRESISTNFALKTERQGTTLQPVIR
jgi:hypothetical protein